MDDVTAFRPAVAAWAQGSAAAPVPVEVGALAATVAVVVLVEGESDRVAIEALAELQQRDLATERVVVLPMNGAMNIRNFVQRLGPTGLGLPLAGLCDIGEERYFRRALQDAGLGTDLTRAGLESLGFFLCDADLEAELIRSRGTDGVEEVMAKQGDLRAFRTFQNQPAQPARSSRRSGRTPLPVRSAFFSSTCERLGEQGWCDVNSRPS